MQVKHFYHVFCAPRWRSIAEEHVAALRESGGTWEMTVGLVGAGEDRAAARSWWTQQVPGTEFIEADAGYEQVTIRALHAWAKQAGPAEPVLYCHTKGTTHEYTREKLGSIHGIMWRRSMTRHVVTDWQHCLELLEDHDAVGCHWTLPGEYTVGIVTVTPHFAGNFWWAKAGYLAALPPVSDESRFHAESWIGLGDPKIADLRPGYPDANFFRLEMIQYMNPGVLG